MKKRILSLVACGALVLGTIGGTVGCGGSGDEINLTVWGPMSQQGILAQQVKEFKAANPDKNYNIKIGICEEDEAYSKIGPDPSAAADVFCYSNDQLAPLLSSGALARIGGSNLETIKSDNSEESVKAGSIAYGTADEKVFGYPYASDNGYFMYYDKSVVSDEEVKTLEGVIAACERAGKEIGWALDVPYYTAGWFFAYGCTFSVEYDYENNYTEKSIEINGFNDEAGLKACRAMAKLTASDSFAGLQTDNNTITTKFANGTMAVAVSGTWLAKTLQTTLGDNYGVCKLPTVNIDGNDVQLSSFKGYKLFGVNPHNSENPAEAHRLALFLSGETMQKERFEQLLVGPTNKVVSALDEVVNDVTLKALAEQNAFALAQASVPSKFWEPLKTVGSYIIDGSVNEDGSNGSSSYQVELDKMVALMTPSN